MAKRWGKLIAPIRPSKSMVELYEKNILSAIKNRPNSVWGLLGCTPEIRTIAGKYQAEIKCIDHNPNAFHAYKVLSDQSKYEEYICSNWLTLTFKEIFDIILGDGSMSMLPIKDHAKFLERIHRIIKPGGYAVLRIYIVAPLMLNSIQKIFTWYRKENNGIPTRLLRQYLYALWLNLDTMSMSNSEYQTKLLEVYKNGFITYEEYEELDITKKPGVNVQYTTKERFEQLISNLFEITSVHYVEDYPLSMNTPLYFLQKK